jgi:hypothetical protein
LVRDSPQFFDSLETAIIEGIVPTHLRRIVRAPCVRLRGLRCYRLFGSRCVGFFGLRCVPIARPRRAGLRGPRCTGLFGPRCVPIARPRRVDCASPVCAGLLGLRRIIRGSLYRILRASLRTDCSASSCRIARAPLYKIVRPPLRTDCSASWRRIARASLYRIARAPLYRIEPAPLRRFARAATGAEWVPRTDGSHAVSVRTDAHTRFILRCSARSAKSHPPPIRASECPRLRPPPPPKASHATIFANDRRDRVSLGRAPPISVKARAPIWPPPMRSSGRTSPEFTAPPSSRCLFFTGGYRGWLRTIDGGSRSTGPVALTTLLLVLTLEEHFRLVRDSGPLTRKRSPNPCK